MDRTDGEAVEPQPLPHSSTWPVAQTNEVEFKKSLTTLFNAKEEHGVVRLSQSDTSFERSHTSLLLRRSQSVQIVPKSASEACLATDPSESAMTMFSGATTPALIHYNGSASTIGSAGHLLTDSRSSGYTTESSYRTATGSNFSLDSSIYLSTRRRSANNHIQEIHVGLEPNATESQVQAIRDDLRSLLSNEVSLIYDTSGGSRQAVYLIAYQYM